MSDDNVFKLIQPGTLTDRLTEVLRDGARLLLTQAVEAEDAKFKAGRMGEYTITKDPTRAKGLRVLMGSFTVYNKDSVEAVAR